jgi:protein-tyrosine phosphatase
MIKKKVKSVIFICTGNIFRSVSAEYCLKQYLSKNKISGWTVGSAGIRAEKDRMSRTVVSTLKQLGVKEINHVQRKVNRDLLNSYDVVVAMAQNHIDFLQDEFGFKRAIMFNELAAGKKSSVLDVEDEVSDPKNNLKAVQKKLESTVRYINSKTPALFSNIQERFYLFSDLASGAIKHRNGFPFIKLYETKNTVAFMSIDIPKKVDGHILVIPKQRYEKLEDIPRDVLNEISESIQNIGRFISKEYGAYNILLNDGKEAGQYILHSHFHVIPRKESDGIKIELWDSKKITEKEFHELNTYFKRHIEMMSRPTGKNQTIKR